MCIEKLFDTRAEVVWILLFPSLAGLHLGFLSRGANVTIAVSGGGGDDYNIISMVLYSIFH